MNDRMNRLHLAMKEADVDAILLTDGYNIHYLSGYKGHTGCMLVLDDKIYILTDSRYTEQVSIEAPSATCVDIGMDGYAKMLLKLVPANTRLGFENNEISYMKYIMKNRQNMNLQLQTKKILFMKKIEIIILFIIS